MGIPNAPPAWLVQGLSIAQSVKNDWGVLLVANIRGLTTPLDDYEGDSIATEFFSNMELDEFVDAFEQANIYCEVVIDEEGFLEWLRHRRSKFARKNLLVYNLAQNGTGPGRLSLIPGLCRLQHLPLLDSDGYVVALTQHKFHCASILEHTGLPIARSWWFTDRGWRSQRPPNGLKVIAKPTYDSASIGIHSDNVFTVEQQANNRLFDKIRQYRQPFIVQEFISGYEVEVPVFGSPEGNTVIAVGIALGHRRNLDDSILSYNNVFNDGYEFYDFAEVNPVLAHELMLLAQKAYTYLGLKGAARIDFRVGSDNLPKIMEVACKPHLTKHSSFMHIMDRLGRSHADLFAYLLGEAVLRLTGQSIN